MARLLSIMFLFSILTTAFTIKCWVCHSDTDPKCADPFDNTTLPIKDCREAKKSHLIEKSDGSLYETLPSRDYNQSEKLMTATMCRKIRQKIHGNWRTIRDCAFLGSPGEGTGNEHHCLYKRGTHDIYLEYCTCNSKDGCNRSYPLEANLISLIYILIIYKLF